MRQHEEEEEAEKPAGHMHGHIITSFTKVVSIVRMNKCSMDMFNAALLLLYMYVPGKSQA